MEAGRFSHVVFHTLIARHPLPSRTMQPVISVSHLSKTYATGFQTRISRLGPEARASVEALGRQALHAYRLGFEHPVTGETMEFEADLPPDLAALQAALRAPLAK